VVVTRDVTVGGGGDVAASHATSSRLTTAIAIDILLVRRVALKRFEERLTGSCLDVIQQSRWAPLPLTLPAIEPEFPD
jgi:hypothetical protein